MRIKFSSIEKKHIIIITIILSFVFSFREWGAEKFSLNAGLLNWLQYLIAVAIILIIKQAAHKIIAEKQGASSELRIWSIKRYGLGKSKQFPVSFLGYKIESLPLGLILSIILSFLSNGIIRFAAVASSEMKEEARMHKKFKNLTHTEIALNSLIGLSLTLLLAILFQTLTFSGINLDKLTTVAYTITLYSLIPLSGLDGAKILLGSKMLYLASAAAILLITILIPTAGIIASIITALLVFLIMFLIYFRNISQN